MAFWWPRSLRLSVGRREIVDQGREGRCKVCKGYLMRAERGTGSVGSSIHIPILLLE